MKIIRPVLCLALVASVSAVGAAGAATKPKPKPLKPVCNLIVDDKDDANFLGEAPNDPNVDIVSGDVASNAKMITAVLRLASFSETDPQAPLGRGYYLLFNAPGLDFPIYFNFQITPDLKRYTWGTRETLATGSGSYVRKGVATGAIDTAKGEIRISVPVAEVGTVGVVKPGAKFTNLTANSTVVIGTSATGGLVSTVDEATGAKPYVSGYPSCVKPG